MKHEKPCILWTVEVYSTRLVGGNGGCEAKPLRSSIIVSPEAQMGVFRGERGALPPKRSG